MFVQHNFVTKIQIKTVKKTSKHEHMHILKKWNFNYTFCSYQGNSSY